MTLLNKSTKIFFNFNFIQKIKTLSKLDYTSKREEFLIFGLWIIFYELLNHRDKELNKYVNTKEEKNGFIKIDFNFIDAFRVLDNKFYTSIKKIYNKYKLNEYINIFFKDIMVVGQDHFYINNKFFLLRFKNKNNQYLTFNNEEFLNNIFTYIKKLDGKKVQDILYITSLGFLCNISSDNEFSILSLTKQRDYNISRLRNKQNEYLDVLMILSGIKQYKYIKKNNCYIINIADKYITKWRAKTFKLCIFKNYLVKIKSLICMKDVYLFKTQYYHGFIEQLPYI